ncbi:MAG TPA: ATP-binding protein [Candidatus Udaeobacter sp.]|jgi:signal transduction histidine kinase|nr:ATP-binding protein [Candidatus Udaeobacter sp.]
MSLRLRLLVLGVVGGAVLLLAFHVPAELVSHWGHYALWVMICVASESMVVPVVSGEGSTSMASTANLATAMLWGPSAAMWICGLSTLVGEKLLVRQKPWVRVLFNAGQTTITMWAATSVFAWLGGPRGGLQSMGQAPLDAASAVRLMPPVIALAVVYLLVSRALVGAAAAWATDRPYLRVLREDWFHAERLIEDSAAFLLAPVMVLSYRSIQYLGVLLFFAPLYMIYLSSRRYIELHRAQDQMVQRERMAAMGRMAAGVGHNMRQQLTAISARAQMITKAEAGPGSDAPRHAQIILDQSRNLTRLADSLMDFAQTRLKVERIDVHNLIHRAIELARTQKTFNSVEWNLELNGRGPEMRADPVQLQQVLLNLLINAAEAMEEKPAGEKRLTVSCGWDERSQRVLIRVSDTGVGIAAAHLARIFDPQFTTKATGHGFGLSTSYTIVDNHGGKISAESAPGQGTTFLVALPLEGPGVWR